MPLTDAERAELDAAEAAFAESGGRGVELAERIDVLRSRLQVATPDGLTPADVLPAVRDALELIDENGDFDSLRDYGIVDDDVHGAAVLALRALRDHLVALEQSRPGSEADPGA